MEIVRQARRSMRAQTFIAVNMQSKQRNQDTRMPSSMVYTNKNNLSFILLIHIGLLYKQMSCVNLLFDQFEHICLLL